VIRRVSAKSAARDEAGLGCITSLPYRLSYFWLIAAVCLIGCKDSAWTPMGSAELVLSQIKVGGASGVSKRLDQDESFGRSVMSGISSGDSLWLDVASRISPPSATAEASLSIALASALPRSPSRVLALLGDKYPVEEVCGIPFLRPAPAFIASYHDSVAAALQSVRDSSLTKVRDACTVALDTARADKLARIDPAYLVKNKPVPPPRAPRKRVPKVVKPVTPPDTGSSD